MICFPVARSTAPFVCILSVALLFARIPSFVMSMMQFEVQARNSFAANYGLKSLQLYLSTRTKVLIQKHDLFPVKNVRGESKSLTDSRVLTAPCLHWVVPQIACAQSITPPYFQLVASRFNALTVMIGLKLHRGGCIFKTVANCRYQMSAGKLLISSSIKYQLGV